MRFDLGAALVAIQFALIAVLAALALPALLAGSAPWIAWLLGAASGALAIWAVAWNRPGNFNIRPAPKEGGMLIRQGPYRWIRHPMYTSILGFGAACALTHGSPWGWLSLAALAACLVVKARVEEEAMLAKHPDYAQYRSRTERFVPGIY